MEWLAGILSFLSALLMGVLPAHTFGYHAAPLVQAQATVIFTGDMMFDRSIRTTADEKGGDYLFSCIDETLQRADLVVGNLEGPITASSSMSVGSAVGSPENFTFTFPTSTAALLYRHNIRLVSIGNNHIMNFGQAGLTQTKEYLSAAGVGYFGDPDAAESDRVARMTVGGVPFSFVNWSDWTSDKTDHTVAQIRAEAQSGRVVVVYNHWGDEYVPPPARVRELAHEMVDAGAAIVIGGHPHIVQEHEVYHGKNIYYSLGNFIFDQYWNDAVSHGLLLQVTFGKSGVASVEELPVVLGRDRRTCPVR
jgi:poly-gamma-glutamate synthesis protein (capsule biosynthesis protein)